MSLSYTPYSIEHTAVDSCSCTTCLRPSKECTWCWNWRRRVTFYLTSIDAAQKPQVRVFRRTALGNYSEVWRQGFVLFTEEESLTGEKHEKCNENVPSQLRRPTSCCDDIISCSLVESNLLLNYPMSSYNVCHLHMQQDVAGVGMQGRLGMSLQTKNQDDFIKQRFWGVYFSIFLETYLRLSSEVTGVILHLFSYQTVTAHSIGVFFVVVSTKN